MFYLKVVLPILGVFWNPWRKIIIIIIISVKRELVCVGWHMYVCMEQVWEL